MATHGADAWGCRRGALWGGALAARPAWHSPRRAALLGALLGLGRCASFKRTGARGQESAEPVAGATSASSAPAPPRFCPACTHQKNCTMAPAHLLNRSLRITSHCDGHLESISLHASPEMSATGVCDPSFWALDTWTHVCARPFTAATILLWASLCHLYMNSSKTVQ